MKLHRGRLFDHVQLLVADLEASKKFYDGLMRVLGVELLEIAPGMFVADELVLVAGDGQTSRIHIAFQTEDRAQVDRAYRAALEVGGRDNGGPGERPHYHPGYYAAFVLDPDGNNVEVVYHGPGERSAASVVITAQTS